MSLVKLNTRPCLILIGCLKYLLGVHYHESFGKHCHGKVMVLLMECFKEPLTKGTFNMLFAKQLLYWLQEPLWLLTAINGVLLWSVRFLRYNFKKSAGQVSFGRGLWETQSVRKVSIVFQSELVLFRSKMIKLKLNLFAEFPITNDDIFTVRKQKTVQLQLNQMSVLFLEGVSGPT